MLDSLTTDPKHQRRGAAMKLVQWGLDIVDNIKGEVGSHSASEITWNPSEFHTVRHISKQQSLDGLCMHL